ncbi:MAG: hypothetical protein NUV51_04560 [Sulfuricaulis sp.]|nr:hypothetical protein [Sulfuricaulis sp.]
MWLEFKTTLLPWLLAAAVIGLLEWRHTADVGRWQEANEMLRTSVDRQAAALEKIGDLLAAQGYTLPPSGAVRPGS